MNGLIQDVRFTMRQLRKQPGFAAVAIGTLALGIAASAVIFSIVYNGVLYPFPYRSADRLTVIGVQDLSEQGDRGNRSMYHLDEVAAFRNGNHTFEDILAYGLWYTVYVHGNTSEVVKGVGATPNAMDFWGVPPLLGRGFGEQDVQSGAPLVVVLNYRYWKDKFRGDPEVLGQTMMLNGKSRTIVGVMPRRFAAVGADLYMPISWTRPEPVRDQHNWDLDDPLYFWATGIIKKNVNFDAASGDIDIIARQMAKTHPDDYPKTFRVTMRWLNDVVLADFKKTLLLLFAAVGLLLFISCSNVAGLLLAHASARTREIALRAAMGASRPRLIRQLLTESFVLAGAGCALGCVLAYVGMKGIMQMHLEHLLPAECEITLNRPVLWFAVGISLLSTLLCGIAPAIHAVRTDLQRGLASTGVNVDASFQHSRFRSGLVIGQVALSLLLLACAGLVARSFIALTHLDLGIRPEKLFTGAVHFPKGRYTKVEEKRAFFDRLLPQLNATPGVINSTTLVGLPMFFAPEGDVTIPGKPHKERWTTDLELCSEGYFQTFGSHLLHGRLLTYDDVFSARKVVVVNQRLAEKYFPGEDPIGRQIKFNVLEEVPDSARDAYFEIVGVIADDRGYEFQGLTPSVRPPSMTIPKGFIPYTMTAFGDRGIAMQTRVTPASLVNNIRQTIWGMDQDVVLMATQIGGAAAFSLSEIMDDAIFYKPRFAAIAFASCAVLGFALAIIGLFSVMTYIVSLKTHDIGVRLALGAPQAAILKMMLQRGLLLIGGGIIIGLLAAIAVTRFLSTEFRGVSATDPLTFFLVIVTVLIAGLSACFLPARRATQVDPMATLRNE